MKNLLTIIFIFVVHIGFAQTDYAINKIPEGLLKDASAVVRNEEQSFEFKTLGSGKVDYKIAITILNKAGDGFAEFAEVYDKFSTIYNIKATLYDASGKKVKDYKSADIKDQSLISDYSIFEDNRIKYLKFFSLTYPYTIEYSYSQDYKGVLTIPSWNALKGFDISTEKAKYTLIQNPGTKVKFLTSPNLKTDSTKLAEKTQYTWQANQIAAMAREPFSIDASDFGFWVKVSPTSFEYDNSTGNFDNWKNFGTWMNNLNENANTLPPATKAQVQNLIKDIKTPKEKINVLYNYLQQNTRYVSVQLGIGGFKPIVAEKVAQVNYGDCKALSNYMKALLNEAGITSNLIVIGNGMPSLNPSYASIGQANHMILAVPLKNDTTFLECTSQHTPMGFIGYDNANRNVLMITADGGKVVKTPKYSSKENYQVRKTKIDFDANGIANINIKSEYGYAQYEDNLSLLLSSPTEQKKAITEDNHIPEAELISFKYEQPNKSAPILTEELVFKSGHLFSKGGDKIFLMVNAINRRESVPAKIDNRKTSFAISFDYQDEDEIVYTLPTGYTVEFIPKDISIDSEFGVYSAKFQTKGNQIIYTRTQVMNAKKFPPEKYNDFVEFSKKIYQADKQKAVLAKAL